eukprot:gene11358-biopygen7844
MFPHDSVRFRTIPRDSARFRTFPHVPLSALGPPMEFGCQRPFGRWWAWDSRLSGVARAGRGRGAGVARAIGYDWAGVARAWRGHGAGVARAFPVPPGVTATPAPPKPKVAYSSRHARASVL